MDARIGSDAARLQREIEHHRTIAPQAEIIWSWDSPTGLVRADRRAAFFVDRARLRPGRRVLELGCGTGVFLRRTAGSGAEIHGLDLSEDLLRQARQRVGALPNVRLTRGNAERTPFPEASFDAVYGSSVLHHLDLDAALRETRRVLRPGGLAVFTEPNLLNPQVAFMFHFGLTKRYFGVSPDEMAFTRFRAQIAVAEAGLKSESIRPFDFLHPATPEAWIRRTAHLGARLERLPVLAELAGSLLIVARKPR